LCDSRRQSKAGRDMPKREPTSAEYQFLLNENDALRAELAELKRIRKENSAYIQSLWDDNRRLHSELAWFNRRELKKTTLYDA
jgi:cell shape-determining protein MreC